MTLLGDRLASLSPERREKILARAEDLIRAERAGRFAPDSNQNAAADRKEFPVKGFLMGLFAKARELFR